MKIGNFDTSEKVLIVAEIGNNHEGDFSLAKEMIDAAAESGADASAPNHHSPQTRIPQEKKESNNSKIFFCSTNSLRSKKEQIKMSCFFQHLSH